MNRIAEAARLIANEADARMREGTPYQDRVAALYATLGDVSMEVQGEMIRARQFRPEHASGQVCCSCGGTADLQYGPDPYAEEIGGDDTPVWECASCRNESAMSI